jgi:hypothetical protein
MPILFRCTCGKQLRAQDEYAGRRVQCPACSSVVSIPDQRTQERSPSTVAGPSMVRFVCTCGKHLRARAEYAGQYTKCPQCAAEVLIPNADAARPTISYQGVVEMKLVPEPATEPGPRFQGGPRPRPLLWPWITAAAVLLAGGGFCLWFFVLRDTSSPSPTNPKPPNQPLADLDWVPRDGLGFISVQVGSWWTSEAGKKARQQLASLNPDALVEKALGVTPADIKRITIVFPDPQASYGVVATSRPYDRAKLLASLTSNARTEQVQGKTIFLIPSGQMAVYPVDERNFIVGQDAAVRNLLTRPASSAREGRLSPALKMTEKHLVVAGFNPPAANLSRAKQNPPPEAKPFLPLLETQSVIFTTDLGEDLQMDLRLIFPDAALAAKGQESANAAIALARQQLGRFKQMVPSDQAEVAKPVFHLLESMLRSVTVERQEQVVHLHLQTEKAVASQAVAAVVPAVQKVRDAAGRATSQNNLRMLAIAMHSYADAHGGKLPPATFGAGLSWRVALLPYLEQGDLYRQFHLNESWNSPHNQTLLPRMPKVFAPVGNVTTKEAHGTFYQVFVGPQAPFNGALEPRMPASFADGTSNTILIAEAAEAVPWTKPDDIPFNIKGPLPKLGGLFATGFNVAMADAAVRFVPRTISEQTLRAAITPAGGDVLGADWGK